MKQEQSRKVNLTKHCKCNHSKGFPLQLTNCICDGTETYDCENIRQNMERYLKEQIRYNLYRFVIKMNFRLCYNKTNLPTSTDPSSTTQIRENIELSTESNAADSAPHKNMSPQLMISILAQYFNGYLGNVLTNLVLLYFH